MKKLALSAAVVALALLLCGGRAHALTYTCPPYPFIFTNGTIADGTQVNANFNSIAACVNNAPFGSGGGSLRLPLTGTKNLYVATTGLDTGQCTASGSPCLTLAYACNQALLDYDQQGFIIAINVADGTYNASGCTISGPQVGAATSGTTPASIWIIGDVATPDNVVINGSHGPATFIITGGGMNVVIEGVKITSSTGSLIFPAYGAVVDIQFVDLGNTGSVNFGMLHSENSGVVKVSGSITLTGTPVNSFIQNCCSAGQTNFIESGVTVKIIGALSMPGGFVSLGMNSIAYINSNLTTFDLSSGSVIGPKYSISSGATLWTQAGTSDQHNTFLPGTLPGVMAENAVYRPSGATYADAKIGLGFLTLFFNGGPLDLWVAPGGSDTTDCQTQAQPCATIQYAVVQALTYYDAMGINVSIRIAPGTYTTQTIIHGPLTGSSGDNTGAGLFLNGTGGSPDNVVISTPGTAFLIDGAGATVNIQDMKITTGGAGDAILAERRAQVAVTNIDFGALGGAGLHSDSGAQILPFGDYTVTGNAAEHFRATNQGTISCLGTYTVTLTGTLTISQFANATDLSLINCDSTMVTWTGGTITGSRYLGSGNSVIDTNAGGANYFPGNTPGSLLSGAQYL